MIRDFHKLSFGLDVLSGLVLAVLVVAVIWASDRAIEITDEAYYVLSGRHPQNIDAFISAQHWILAPLWSLSGSLALFRLSGLVILLVSSWVLALGAWRVACGLELIEPNRKAGAALCAASSIGALLYVCTIAPSPSYNLLASAGGYAGLGFACLAAASTSRSQGALWAFLSGALLVIAFVNKPSSGVCCTVVSLVALWAFRRTSGRLNLSIALSAGFGITLAALYGYHARDRDVLASLQAGFDLFRQVQTEPVLDRLQRYAVTMVQSIGHALLLFSPALAMCAALLRVPRTWMPKAIAALLLVSIVVGQHHLGGRTQYQAQIEAVLAILVATALCSVSAWVHEWRRVILVLCLFGLPYAVAMGSGNALFTQVIVSLAGWTALAYLLAISQPRTDLRGQAARLCAGFMLVLLCAQILSSYTRDPYHLDQPLIAQANAVDVPVLGPLRVDNKTAAMLTDLERAREACQIAPGAAFLGIYNVPGLALLLDAVPPVSPWINNRVQLVSILEAWRPRGRVILALSTAAQVDRNLLPDDLQPIDEKYEFCGTLIVPFSDEPIEIWASSQN